jgi:hypothetical protein
VSNVAWITVSAGSGTGSGTARYAVAANTGPARSGTVGVAGVLFTVTQAAGTPPPCTFDASPRAESFPVAGGDGNVRVTASQPSCAWTATSQAPWITITAGSGNGNGTARYAVAANTGEARSGTVTVAGIVITVSQAAVVPCQFTVSPQTATFVALGGSGTVRVDASAGNCAWTAVSNTPWITITTGSGSGNGDARYLVGINLGAARTGTLTVAGTTVTVNQDAVLPEQVELRGQMSALSGVCPNVMFTLEGRLVRTNSQTDFDERCDRLEDGRNIRVNGVVQLDASVLSTRVRR